VFPKPIAPFNSKTATLSFEETASENGTAENVNVKTGQNRYQHGF